MTTTEQPATWHAVDGHLDDDERELIWQDGYSRGHNAALDARPPATVWAPHPITWRHAAAGDGFVGDDGRLWHVEHTELVDEHTVHVRARCGADVFEVPVPADEDLQVLIPTPERDAVELVVEQLGAVLVGRREESTMTG